jgi:hypothetical protein
MTSGESASLVLVLGLAGSARAAFVTNRSSSKACPAARVLPIDCPRFCVVFQAKTVAAFEVAP